MWRLWGIIGFAWVWAQENPFVAYKRAPKGWEALEVGPVGVWYVRGQEGLARQVGTWAADAYRELTGLLEFSLERPLIVRLHPSPVAWGQQPPWNPRGALVAPPPLIEVFPGGTRATTAAIVRSQVIGAILEHLYFSEGVRLQNRALLYMPDWFLWGFAFFWGEGWTGEDYARLQLMPENALILLAERTARPSPFYKSLYKSLWFYIYRTYGQRKLIDLLYMARLTRNIPEALAFTLNISEEELAEKWRSFLDILQEKPTLSPESEEIFRKAVLSAAVSPDGQKVAYAVLQQGQVRYYLRLEEEEYSLGGSWPWPGGYYELNLPMAFSSEGRLAWLSYEMEGPVLWHWAVGDKQYQRLPISLRAVESLRWTQGGTLLIAGMDDRGEVAVYTLTLPSGALRKLGQLQGDFYAPAEAQGDYWAAWQPDTVGPASLSVLWEPARPVRYHAGSWEPLPFPPYYEVKGGWVVGDTLMATLTDVTGQGCAWLLWRDSSAASAWRTVGLARWIGQATEKAYFLRYRGGRLRIGAVPLSQLWQKGAAFPSLLAAEIIQFRLQRRAMYLAAAKGHSEKPLPRTDTLRGDTLSQKPSAFYLFDEDVSRPVRRRRQKAVEPTQKSYFLPESKPQGAVPYHWLLWDVRMGPVLHPLMRLGWQVSASARDPHGDHAWSFAWTPYIDLRSSEFALSYTRYRSAFQPFTQLRKQSHYFPATRYGRTLRNTTWQGELGLRYVIRPGIAVEGALLGIDATRYDLQTTDAQDLSGHARWWGGRAQLQYERIAYRETFPWQGWQGTLRGEAYQGEGGWTFPLIALHIRRFQPVARAFVVEAAGSAALGGTRGRYFFLGGVPDWINYDFQNRSQVPTLGPIGAYYMSEYHYLPGFPYQARRGRNLLSASVVARFPILAWRREPSLPVKNTYTFEWQIGYYVATTWTTGNPFSQKNPIDAEYIYRPPLIISVQTLKSPFLMSIGTGLRFQVMRLPIGVEVYWPIEEGRVSAARFLVGFKQGL